MCSMTNNSPIATQAGFQNGGPKTAVAWIIKKAKLA